MKQNILLGRTLLAVSLSLLVGASAFSKAPLKTKKSKLISKTYDYKIGDQDFEGYLSYEASANKTKKPAVIIVHDWTGVGDYVKKRADMVAELGYVAFAADIYGKGIRGSNAEESSKLASIYKSDRKLMRDRIRAAYDEVAKLPQVDAKNIVVMGYCFGGTVALELARSGAYLKGTVTFHGGLSTPHPEEAKNIQGKVLVLHGADDPYANQQEVNAFEDEMRKGKVDWRLVLYGNTVHSFTLWDLPQDNSTGAAYNPDSDKKSWEELKNFLAEVL